MIKNPILKSQKEDKNTFNSGLVLCIFKFFENVLFSHLKYLFNQNIIVSIILDKHYSIKKYNFPTKSIHWINKNKMN